MDMEWNSTLYESYEDKWEGRIRTLCVTSRRQNGTQLFKLFPFSVDGYGNINFSGCTPSLYEHVERSIDVFVYMHIMHVMMT
ncbi:hypothetical protein VNO77_21596 [Canavalia gladiata]|uniref:Uncharacterized protein n=1 Tax=Canavalia gladiata TaxID=3824 RepID=A0AAN9QM97_CANGL